METNYTKPSYDIYVAMQKHDLEAVKYYIEVERVNPNRQFNERERATLLSFAARVSNVQIIKYLISKGADPYLNDSDLVATPMHYSCLNGVVENVKYFILDKDGPRMDPNLLSSIKRTPLHMAVLKYNRDREVSEKDRFEVVKLLVEKTKADLNAKDYFSNKPNAIAVRSGFFEIAKYLNDHMDKLVVVSPAKSNKPNLKLFKNKEIKLNFQRIDQQMNSLRLSSNEQASSWRVGNEESNANLNLQNMDLQSILILFNVMVRKFTNQKFITDYVEPSLMEVKVSGLNIIHSFEEILGKMSVKFGISFNNFDSMKLFTDLIWYLRNDKLKEIPDLLISAVYNDKDNELKNHFKQLEMNIKKILIKEFNKLWPNKFEEESLSNDQKLIFTNKFQNQLIKQLEAIKIEKLN